MFSETSINLVRLLLNQPTKILRSVIYFWNVLGSTLSFSLFRNWGFKWFQFGLFEWVCHFLIQPSSGGAAVPHKQFLSSVQVCRKVWKSRGKSSNVVGIIYSPQVGIGLTDLPKSVVGALQWHWIWRWLFDIGFRPSWIS